MIKYSCSCVHSIRDIINYQFSKSTILPESSLHDSIMCAVVADIDWDGVNEIILGTYGKKLLIYKCKMTGMYIHAY